MDYDCYHPCYTDPKFRKRSSATPVEEDRIDQILLALDQALRRLATAALTCEGTPEAVGIFKDAASFEVVEDRGIFEAGGVPKVGRNFGSPRAAVFEGELRIKAGGVAMQAAKVEGVAPARRVHHISVECPWQRRVST